MKIKNSLHSALSYITGSNNEYTPKDVIIAQMNEPRPLPMGMRDFQKWSRRIILGALLPSGKEDPKIFYDSQVFALANMLMHLGPTESHKPDAFFIHSLRKVAVNQVADAVRRELHEKAKARTEAEEEAKKTEEQKAAEAAAESTLARANEVMKNEE